MNQTLFSKWCSANHRITEETLERRML
uniref:Uncharacterized protein n=1 Tax=Anguilla anguilla TaxID=7936 RepID=A0A0E9VKH6_ANGAN